MTLTKLQASALQFITDHAGDVYPANLTDIKRAFKIRASQAIELLYRLEELGLITIYKDGRAWRALLPTKKQASDLLESELTSPREYITECPTCGCKIVAKGITKSHDTYIECLEALATVLFYDVKRIIAVMKAEIELRKKLEK